jgi:hypothetical protein
MTPRLPNETDQDYLRRLATDGDAEEQLRAIAEHEDTWQLQREDGESDDDFAIRALALGCDETYCRRIPWWRLSGSLRRADVNCS